MEPRITIPTIHLNGTSAESLLDGACRASGALRDAIRAIQEHASPNGRDYYVQGPDAMLKAQEEHQSRIDRLRSVLAELEAMADAISEAKDEREALRRCP